ncbi:MAG: hypothetical protein ABMA64_22445 [Myxococcota bacterium]
MDIGIETHRAIEDACRALADRDDPDRRSLGLTLRSRDDLPEAPRRLVSAVADRLVNGFPPGVGTATGDAIVRSALRAVLESDDGVIADHLHALDALGPVPEWSDLFAPIHLQRAPRDPPLPSRQRPSRLDRLAAVQVVAIPLLRTHAAEVAEGRVDPSLERVLDQIHDDATWFGWTAVTSLAERCLERTTTLSTLLDALTALADAIERGAEGAPVPQLDRLLTAP